MAAWWDGASLVLEFSPTTNPLDTPVWVDVTQYMRQPVTTSRGRRDEDADFAPGSMSVSLDNGDRRFDPEYAAGPFFGNLKPMRRIRLRANVSATDYTVFDGYVTRWGQRWEQHDGIAVLDCVDGSRFFRSARLAHCAYEAHVIDDAPNHYWTLKDLNNFEDLAGSIQLGLESLPNVPDPLVTISPGSVPFDTPFMLFHGRGRNAYSGPGIKAVEFWGWVDGPLSGSANAFSVEVANSTSRMSIATALQQIQVFYDDTLANRNVFNLNAPLVEGMHHYAVIVDAVNVTIFIDGVSAGSTALAVGSLAPTTTGVAVQATRSDSSSGGISHVALYSTPPSTSRWLERFRLASYGYGHPTADTGGVRIGRVLDEIGWPAGRRVLSDGVTLHKRYVALGEDALTYMRHVERAEQGLLFFDVDGNIVFRDRQWLWTQADSGVVFSDDGAGGSVLYAAGDPEGNDIDTVRNVITVSYSNVGAITNRDSASIASHFPAEEFLECPTLPDGSSASLLGQYVLRLRKDPATVFPELEVDMRPAVSTQMPAVLGLEIGDVVTFERTPMNVGSQIVKKAVVYGVEHQIHADQWTTLLYLSPPVVTAETGPYLTLGHATRGVLGTTAGNKLPY